MSQITTSQYASDLLPLVKNWFGIAYPNIPTYYDKIAAVEQADARSYQVDALAIGFNLLQAKDEGTSITYDFSKQGHTPIYRHATYALGFQITMEMMSDGDAMRNAKKFTEMLKYSGMQTKEVLMAAVYNNAFDSNYTMTNGDGVQLVSSSHPVVASTQSNLITGGSVDISEAAIEQVLIDIKNMRNARGIRIGAMPQKLLVSVSDEATANRIVYSDLRVATADNDLNYIRANNKLPGGIVANPFFTDSDAWFVTTNVPDGVKYLNRQDLTLDDSNDFETKSGKFSVIMRCSQGWTDWRGVVGSAGA